MNDDRLLALYDRVADAPHVVGRLRQFVLKLAVRGNLVEQDPADEPASALLRRMAKQKAKLTPAARTRRRRVLDSSPVVRRFGIPVSWEWSAIQAVAHVEMGQSPRSEHYNKTGNGLAFFQGKADFGPRHPTPRSWCTKPTKIAERGDILLSVRAPVGPTNVADRQCCIGRGLAALRPLEGLDREFMLLALRAFEADLAAQGFGTTFEAITKKQLTTYGFPLPPLAEQHRIVAKANELLALCDRLEETRVVREEARDQLSTASLTRLKEPETDATTFRAHVRFAVDALPAITARRDQVKELRQTILNLAVHGKLVEQEPGDEPASVLLKRIESAMELVPVRGRKTKRAAVHSSLEKPAISLPAGWEHARLSQLVRVLNGRAYRKDELLDSGTPVLRVGNLFTSKHWYYSDLQLAEDKYCDEGDLLYAWSASFGPVLWQDPRVIFHYHIWKLSLFSEADLDKRFLYYFLLQHTQEIKSAGHGISMIHMTKGKMERLSVPLPPLTEQHRIVAKVDELMAFCDRLKVGLGATEAAQGRLIDSLIHESLASHET